MIKENKYLKVLVAILFLFLSSGLSSQPVVIDKIVATVGKQIILLSDVEIQYQQAVMQGSPSGDETKCDILNQLLLQKLMINQAQLDSVEVTESQVESELDRRLRYFINQIGSEEKLEEYYKKSILEIKAEFKENIRDQMLAQTIQTKITKDVNASPSDVRAYFNRIPPDSLPYINEEFEIAHITKKPPINPTEKAEVKEQLEGLRQRIIKGADFAALAALYSQDPGSARKGGELGFVSRGDLVPEFEAAAFNLKATEVSPIVETQFGFHIIQLIEKRGKQINVRHILMTPKINPSDLMTARNQLDSIAEAIRNGSISFSDAALRFSDDKETKFNGGLMINPMTGITKFESDQLDPTLFFQIDKQKTGEISSPVIMTSSDGKQAYRLLMVKSRTEPHRANLKDDYQQIQNACLAEKQNFAITEWVNRKKSITYINIDAQYHKCSEIIIWLN